MDTGKPYDSIHRFTAGGGRQVIEGKASWPHLLRVEMPEFHAWNLVQRMLDRLRDAQPGQIVTFDLSGQLTEETE